ncbi:MAG: ATP-binding protein [Myxococcota bacterium]|jgi:PAS domain S-box-containing protein|nr:ATP-binding protein [Myxococcota bacterium]
MNWNALISLGSFIVCVALAAYVYHRNAKVSANRLFGLLYTVLAAMALVDWQYRQATSQDLAVFFWHFDFLWPFSTSLNIHLARVLVKPRQKVSKRLQLAIHGPAAFFSMSEILAGWITGPPQPQGLGWTQGAPAFLPMAVLAYAWIFAGLVGASSYVLMALRRTTGPRRTRLLLALLGIMTSASGFGAELSLRVMGIEGPSWNAVGFTLAGFFLGYACWKHDLFSLTATEAAENILSTMTDSLWLVDQSARIVKVNAAATRMLGYSEEEMLAMDVRQLFASSSKRPIWFDSTITTNSSSTWRIKDLESELVTVKGHHIPVSLSSSVQWSEDDEVRGYILIGRDITERKASELELTRHRRHLEDTVKRRTGQLENANELLRRQMTEKEQADAQRASLELQLSQAQKMEAIGRLAGGVAHDFNNLLTVIISNTDLLLDSLPPDLPDRQDVDEIKNAAKQAAGLTQQLLAFSRRQIASPQLVDLCTHVAKTQRMLSRLIGEDVELRFSCGSESTFIHIDPVQLEQIVINLVVNARDAMPDGGTISIVIKPCDDTLVRWAPPRGERMARLSISDTGCGMTEEVKSKIFEPFFTTKGIGKGTGLGLSTVYGIVKQNCGFIDVSTEVGSGTTFDLFFPLADERTELLEGRDVGFLQPGSETILLVEDEAPVRVATSKMLKRQGYIVLEAKDAHEALLLLESYPLPIDLLLTDVVMPGMSGKQLRDEVHSRKPSLKVLFISGYNEEIIDQHGLLAPGTNLLQKPFEMTSLANRVREVLDCSDKN